MVNVINTKGKTQVKFSESLYSRLKYKHSICYETNSLFLYSLQKVTHTLKIIVTDVAVLIFVHQITKKVMTKLSISISS